VNAAGQRKREDALGGLDDHDDGLERVAKNKLGFGIVLRFLMKLFDRRHFASGLGSLDAVGKQHDASVDGEEMGLEKEQWVELSLTISQLRLKVGKSQT